MDVVFAVVDPIADAGDNAVALPIMQLIVDLVPNHCMALFHLGIAQYGTDDVAADRNLKAFLRLYNVNDRFRAAGVRVADRIAQRLPPEQGVNYGH